MITKLAVQNNLISATIPPLHNHSIGVCAIVQPNNDCSIEMHQFCLIVVECFKDLHCNLSGKEFIYNILLIVYIAAMNKIIVEFNEMFNYFNYVHIAN